MSMSNRIGMHLTTTLHRIFNRMWTSLTSSSTRWGWIWIKRRRPNRITWIRGRPSRGRMRRYRISRSKSSYCHKLWTRKGRAKSFSSRLKSKWLRQRSSSSGASYFYNRKRKGRKWKLGASLAQTSRTSSAQEISRIWAKYSPMSSLRRCTLWRKWSINSHRWITRLKLITTIRRCRFFHPSSQRSICSWSRSQKSLHRPDLTKRTTLVLVSSHKAPISTTLKLTTIDLKIL